MAKMGMAYISLLDVPFQLVTDEILEKAAAFRDALEEIR